MKQSDVPLKHREILYKFPKYLLLKWGKKFSRISRIVLRIRENNFLNIRETFYSQGKFGKIEISYSMIKRIIP